MKRFLALVGLLIALYFGAYFAFMEKGTAVNPDTKLPEYKSISKFADGLRIRGGPIDLGIADSHWTNPIFEPLDRLFR